MSWMKRGQAGAGAGAQPYAAPQAQPYGNQQTMYQNYPGGVGPAGAQPPQQQYWPAPLQPQQPPQQPPQAAPQQYNHGQPYSQAYPPEYPPNANQYQQPVQAQYNQNYANQYANPQQNLPHNYYQNQPMQQNLTQNYSQNAVNTTSAGTGNADGWEDNWDWGWDENAKKAQSLQNTAAQPIQPIQQQVFNNANVIEESFARTDTWNWATDENKDSKPPSAAPPPTRVVNHEPATLPPHPVESNGSHEPAQNSANNGQAEEVKTLSDREVVKERLPNLALGKRFHIENLTPQWSIESQMSQESSDGPHTQSEGTYRSENQSRNSGESPGPNTDNSNFNYAQQGFDETYTQNSEWSKNSDEPTVADGSRSSRRESHEELSNSLQEMSIANDHHTTNNRFSPFLVESKSVQESVQPPPSGSPANFPPPASGSASAPSLSMLPPPPASSALPQMPPPTSLQALPRPPSSSSSSSLGRSTPAQANPPRPPPTSSPATLPPPPNSQNPFQRAGPFSHRSTTRTATAPAQPFQPSMTGSNLSSPAVVNKVSQSGGPAGFEANLETTPDNSERPDQPQVPFRATPAPQPVPDNMEVAPRNDRNEYLQTAHLSGGDYGENADFARNMPPPGLRRMVVGRQESEYQNLNISGDEPPPGLSRMVPGQQTENDNAYSQPGDAYMDRHVVGQPTDSAGSPRPYRQADGQQNPDGYSQPVTSRASDRRPVGFDRMVPGEPSDDEYSQYQGSNYAGNDHRVVTGVDRDFPGRIEAGPSDVRERNMDGSDYTEPASRNVIGARETSSEVTPDETQREVTVEGENLQDLSVISSADLTYSREHLDGADQNVTDGGMDRNDASDSLDRPVTSSRKQSLNRIHSSGDDSERDRAFKASPRRDRHKTSRDRDTDRTRGGDKEGSRYSRGDRSDRKYDKDDRRRDDKRSDKERRDRERGREGDASPDARKYRRSTRSRKYDEDDTDYYSDRERDRRRYREGSYTSKPPRGSERDRLYEEGRRPRPRDSTRRDTRDRHYDYRDIDPSRKYGNLHREREDERRRVTFSTDAKSNDSKSEGETFSSASRPDSREAGATDEDVAEARRSQARARRPRHHRSDPYYDGYSSAGYQDPYLVQRQQYEYYEQLRVTDPAQYMLVYKQLMAGHLPPAPPHTPAPPRARHYAAGEGYPSLGYDGQERGSVHSGRSSTTGLKGNDTFYVYRQDGASLRDAPSLRTDVSDRDLNTDASLGLQLDESTVRSERMTPFRYSTAHIKASLGSRDIVVVPPSYPVDGRPATVHVLSLASARATDPVASELIHSPGPLVKGVTHKKSVVEYCLVRARAGEQEGARDVTGYVLLWELLALLLRQNGVVVGTDIAELLMKKPQEEQDSSPGDHDDLSDTMGAESPSSRSAGERAALDKFREHLLYGNRQEALEWAMNNNLWGHALHLASTGERRARACVAARFLASIPSADPLHTLYCAHAHGTAPPAATCMSDQRDGWWRAHAAMLLANASSRPEQDARTLTTLGDTLSSRGLIYSAQFCYLSAGVPFSRHSLAPLSPAPPPGGSPPRLALLLADPRATSLSQLATTRAILATEIYEYARSLNADYVIDELQVYKLILATRLADAGLYSRALAYVEAAARAVTRPAPATPPSRALLTALADLADRLKYHEGALTAGVVGVVGVAGEEGEGGSGEGSPARHWIDDVRLLAHNLQVESASQQVTPQHQYPAPHQYYGYENQAQQYQTPTQSYEPEPTDPSPYYQPPESQVQVPPAPERAGYPAQDPPSPHPAPAQSEAPLETEPAPQEEHQYQYEDWTRTEETHQLSYGEPYWQGDNPYNYGEPAESEPRPSITMPGAAPAKQPQYNYEEDRPPSQHGGAEEPPPSSKDSKSKEVKTDSKGRSWIGGILTKLSLRPPNQMILPDDKNPTIVWDAGAQRWRSTDGSDDEPAHPPPPPQAPPVTRTTASPPLAGAGGPGGATGGPGGAAGGPGGAAPPTAPVSNIFKMQKGRHIKKSYVDVFNPGGEARPLPPAAEVLGPPAPPLNAAPTYFVPPSTHQGGYNADDQYPRSGI